MAPIRVQSLEVVTFHEPCASLMGDSCEGDTQSYFEAPDHSSLDGGLGGVFTVEAWLNPAINLGDDTHPPGLGLRQPSRLRGAP